MNNITAELKNAMVAQLNRNNVVANNLANANTQGFKRDVMFSEFLSNEHGTTLASHVETDFSQGSLVQTNNPLDAAISGRGFFTVELEEGEAYTRDGHFNIGPDGVLRTSGGHPLIGQSGWVDLKGDGIESSDVVINQRGEIFLGSEMVDKLLISDFENMNQLNKMGQNLYSAQEHQIAHVIDDPTVIQGKIESSNVEAIHEMVELIQLQRQFETSQRAIRSLDTANGKAVNSVGRYR